MKYEDIPPLPADEAVRIAVGTSVCDCGNVHIVVQVRDETIGVVSQNVLTVDRAIAFALAESVTRPFVMHSIDDLLAEIKTTETIERARKGNGNG